MVAAETGDSVAFRYALPPTPLASADVEIGYVAVTIELRLSGDLDVLTATADRTRALTAVRCVAKGLMIRGLGSPAPSVSASAGHRFTQSHHDFRAPNTVTFAGDCAIDFTHRAVAVRGAAAYALTVTAMPTADHAPTDDDTESGWFLRHEKELASIGMVLLVAAPVTPGRLTLC
jgi:hypothetical protein